MGKGFVKADISRKKSSKSSSITPALDCEQLQQQLAEHFENLEDPRGSQGVLHPFMSLVTIALLATIGGAKGWEDLETYGVSHESWLSSFLELPFGIPSADTRCGELCAFLGGYLREYHQLNLNRAFKTG